MIVIIQGLKMNVWYTSTWSLHRAVFYIRNATKINAKIFWSWEKIFVAFWAWFSWIKKIFELSNHEIRTGTLRDIFLWKVLGVEVNIGVNSWNHRKAHLRPILNQYTQFQSCRLSCRKVMRGKNSKNRKTDEKLDFWGGSGGGIEGMRLKRWNLHKAHLWLLHHLLT